MTWQTMRGAVIWGLCLALWGTAVGAGAQAAGGATPGRDQCADLARSLKALEAEGMRAVLARDPAEVEKTLGAGAVRQVRDYIALREKVLFSCPPFVLNATAAPLAERLAKAPPLPGKGPKLNRRPAAPARVLVPLPVRRPI